MNPTDGVGRYACEVGALWVFWLPRQCRIIALPRTAQRTLLQECLFCFSIPPNHHSSDSSRSLFLLFLIALKPLSLPIQSHAYPVLATSHPHQYAMDPRRASTHGSISTPALRRRAPAGVRNKRRIRQASSRYGRQRGPDRSTPGTEHPNSRSSNSE